MMDTAAAFLFRGLTSSKAKQVPQTLTHTHRRRGCSGCQRQGTAFNSIHTLNAFRSDVTARFPSSSSTGKGWHSVVKVRALLCIPQALPWPLCSPAGPLGACCKQSHRCTPHLWISKNTNMNPAHLIPLWGPRATQWLVQLENCEWMHTPHNSCTPLSFLMADQLASGGFWHCLCLSLVWQFVSLSFYLSLPLSDYYPLEEVLDWIKLMKLIISTCPTQTGCGIGNSDSLSSVICFRPTQRLGRHLAS